MVTNDYGIKQKPSSVRNSQSNAIIERIHQMISNILQSFDLTQIELDKDDLFSGILAAMMFATRATYHTTLQATPTQLVFGRHAILNSTFEANWKYIKDRKQKFIDQNNAKENSKPIPH